MKMSKQKTIEDVFHMINRKYVKINKKARMRNNTILFSVIGQILKIMRDTNELFRSMKPKIEYLGSYFEGLRVGFPNEYDLNIILKFPVNYDKISLDASGTDSDYTSIKMHSEFQRLSLTPATIRKGFIHTKRWCDSEHRLSVSKFRSWMQSVVDTALTTLPLKNCKRVLRVNHKNYLIFTKISGPANTITIVPENDETNFIDVDLVPTLTFELPKKPKSTRVIFKKVEDGNCKKYFVVPKPTLYDYGWRLAFPHQERHLLNNRHNLKSALKLLKLLRDVQGFKQLASYHIKTLFLWESMHTESKFWTKKSLTYLVVHMMKKLKDCLEKGIIKNFWAPDFNLIKDKIKLETCINWSNRLTLIINDIERHGKINPRIVMDYFACKK